MDHFYDKDYSLNNLECVKIIGFDVMIVPFDRVHSYSNIDDLFVNNCCLINYLQGDNFGHWVAMERQGGVVTFFDPLGNYPDDINRNYDMEWQAKPYILNLIKKSRYTCYYNEDVLQKGFSTCGRWSSLFLRYRAMGYENFCKIFKGTIDNDDLVTQITGDILSSSQ